MTIRFDTTEYQASHGKTPRGDGQWAFYLHRCDEMTTVFTPFPMTYTAAKRFALSEARAVGGIVEIYVAP